MLSKVGLKVGFEWVAVGLLKGNWRSNVEVVHKVGDMQEDRVTSLMYMSVSAVQVYWRRANLGDAKELDCGLASVECTLLGIDLLET